MARISGLEPRVDYGKEMSLILINDLQNNYKKLKVGFEVNDGKYLTFIDDREVDDESRSK